jgi:hypothetical protein
MEMQAGNTGEHERSASADGTAAGPSILANSAGFLSPNAASTENMHQRKAARTVGETHAVGGAVFPGCYGPLHSVNNKEFAIDSTLGHQLQELTFNETVDLSYMFNYIEPQGRLGKKRVKVQLDDTNWSRPFSLDSVGVNQMLTVNNPARGCMEMGFKISVAPGRLAKYTKILRFLPRFSIVNKLPVSLKILQPTGFAGEAAELDVSAEKVRPYHLPAMFGERQIALQLDGGWHRSIAFDIDQIGVFNMQVKRRVNLASIQHVNTRGASEYTEILPPMRTLGVYFETDWGEENIVVKSFQKGSYAAINTDIKIGDVLLQIDDEPVDGKKFELAMVLMRNKLGSASGCTVRFRTVEEKIKLIRESALSANAKHPRTRKRAAGTPGAGVSASGGAHGTAPLDGESFDDLGLSPRPGQDNNSGRSDGTYVVGESGTVKLEIDHLDYPNFEERILGHAHGAGLTQKELRERAKDRDQDRMVLRVELRQVESSAMIFVQELGTHVNAEYRVENKSVCYKLFYKQKGIAGNNWLMLNPGQSRSFVWEDPFKPHKLLVHTGDNVLSPVSHQAHVTSGQAGQFLSKRDGDDVVSTYWGYLAGLSTDQATVVNFDEIGSKETMFVSHKSDLKMIATVKSEGPTKILLITPAVENRQVIRELRYCSEFINEQLNLVSQLIERLALLSRFSSTPTILASKLALFESQYEEVFVRMQEKQTKLLEIDEALCGGNSAKLNALNARGSFSAAMKHAAEEVAADGAHLPVAPSGLVSYRPVERVLDLGIDKQHQLEVNVLEAKELTALVAGKMEDVYCKVLIKADDLTVVTQ